MEDVWNAIRGRRLQAIRRVDAYTVQLKFDGDVVLTFGIWTDYDRCGLTCQVEPGPEEWQFTEQED